jgi:hypothetical protein
MAAEQLREYVGERFDQLSRSFLPRARAFLNAECHTHSGGYRRWRHEISKAFFLQANTPYMG